MITNTTKKFKIIDKAKPCTSIGSKALGMMFRLKRPKEALIFIFDNEKRADLHMLFVFFPIDVLFLDKDKKVVDIKKDFKPFTYYSPKAKAQYVIELPIGVMGSTRIGDKIKFN
ncbi:DUF192 domain-containing protein [Candidatus Woesearchaeota archaeon]|nr:DUF192 domain-containing protein [Candidatus Woesearchaeota archaeon]